MRNWNVGLIVLWITTSCSWADLCLVSESPGDQLKSRGDQAESGAFFTTASTFKPVIALAALEKGVATPQTLAWVEDAHIPGGRQQLTLAKAMYWSSNSYFIALLKQLSDRELMATAEKTGFGTLTEKLPLANREDWKKGGPYRITPEQQHKFMKRLVGDDLPYSAERLRQLREVMAWPAKKNLEVIGKTGSWEKIYWFNGAARRSAGWKVVTILLTAPGSNRNQAVRRFYEEIGDEVPADFRQ
jgi:beta-lactamase class D